MKKVIRKPIINIPKYHVGQLLYAISFSNDSIDNIDQAAKQDEWGRDFARIHKAQVDSISIGTDGISYWLKDAKDDTAYGDSIYEKYVSDNIDYLVEILLNRWKL